MNRCVTLCLMTILLSTVNAFTQAPRKTRPSKQQPNISRPTDFGKFIGMWEYAPDSLQKKYFKVNEEQPGNFKFIEGFEYQGRITWVETMLNNADGIYLKPLNGKLTGRFTSPNFRATHGQDITYRITLSLEPNGNLLYSVSSELEPERYHAAKINNGEDTGEVAVSQARAATAVTPSVSAQSKARKSRAVSKPQARKTSNVSATPGVISRFIKAIQGRDFKTVIDLTYSYQIEVSGIKSQNPRVLWEKKVGEFYERKISEITGEASFWGDYFRGVGAMTGDPAQNFRAVAYLLPQSCKWQISETRNETITSVIEGQFNQTTVYVTVDYPLDESTPIVNKRFLKQTMLKFGVRSGTQSVANVYQVGEVNTFWAKPYPKEATAFLVSKYKDDILKGDKDAINEVIEIAGWEVVEPYLLEVAEQQPPYTKPFNLVIDTLADHRVQKAVPIIVKALRGRNPIEILVEGEGWWSRPDINLVTALQKIGKSEFNNEATLILKERLSKIIGKDRDWINIHLAALASVDDDAWSSFPNRNFEAIVKEVSRKQRNASVIDSSSSNNAIMAFFGSLRPCNRGVGYRCPSDLRYGSVKIIDARTVEVYGQIDEDRGGFDFRKVGNFTMVLKRKDHQLDKWLVQEITRQN